MPGICSRLCSMPVSLPGVGGFLNLLSCPRQVNPAVVFRTCNESFSADSSSAHNYSRPLENSKVVDIFSSNGTKLDISENLFVGSPQCTRLIFTSWRHFRLLRSTVVLFVRLRSCISVNLLFQPRSASL